MSGFPAPYCRVVASRSEGNDAVVLLDTGSDGTRYLYVVMCARRDGRWEQGSSGNCLGWSRTDPIEDFESSGEPEDWDDSPDLSLGSLTLWDEAPPDADMVRVEFEGKVSEEPVVNGVYMLAWFKVPCPDEHPRAVAFRVRGKWTPSLPWPVPRRHT